VTTNSWINVYIGNNPRYDNVKEYRWVVPEGTRWNQRPRLHGEDEYEVMVRSRQEALRYIASHPGAFARRFVARFVRFLTPHFDLVRKIEEGVVVKAAILFDLLVYTLCLLAFLLLLMRGGWGMFRTDPFLGFSVAFVLYLTTVAGVTFTNSRFRFPLTVLLMAYSSRSFGALANGLRRR